MRGHGGPGHDMKEEEALASASRMEAMEKGEVPAPSSSSGGSMCSPSVHKYRWLEIIALLILPGLFTLTAYFSQNYQEVPRVYVVSDTGAQAVANNSMYSYPITLQGHLCYPHTLLLCGHGTNAPGDPCCAALKNEKVKPGMTVPTEILVVILALVPLCILILRHSLINRCTNVKTRQSFLDALLGFIFAISLAISAEFMVKSLCGVPRPNHYALRLWMEYTAHPPRKNKFDPWQSFPSGHASFSMAGFLYISLLLLEDVQRFCASKYSLKPLRSILDWLALIPVFFALWLSITVVQDYWHTATDMVGGFVIGGAAAYAAYRYTLPQFDPPTTRSMNGH